jgi:hypothetical protein
LHHRHDGHNVVCYRLAGVSRYPQPFPLHRCCLS